MGPKKEPSSPSVPPPTPFEQRDVLLRNQKHKKTLVAIAVGLAFHYNEILRSWKICGANNICKAEKLTAYITMIFGVSKPAVFMTETIHRLINKLSTKVGGTSLLEKDSRWHSSVLITIVYSGMEYGLSTVWEWVRYSTQCLTRHDCENDDILIWIMNMKNRFCDVKDDDILYECDEDGQHCEIVDIDSGSGSVPSKGICMLIFNQLPLIMLGIVIWTLFVLSDYADEVEQNSDGADEQTSSVPEKVQEVQENEKSSDDRKPSKQTNLTRLRGKKKTEEPPPFQELEVYCPLCNEYYIACFPEPLTICCGDCGGTPRLHAGDSENPLSENITPPISVQEDCNNTLHTLGKCSTLCKSNPETVNLWFEQDPQQPPGNFSVTVQSGIVIAEEEFVILSSTQDNMRICTLRKMSTLEETDQRNNNNALSDEDHELYQLFTDLLQNQRLEIESAINACKEACLTSDNHNTAEPNNLNHI